MASDIATNMRNTSIAFLEAFDQWTAKAIMALRSKNSEQIILPASLGIPKRNYEESFAYFKGIEGTLTNVRMTMHDYFASVEDRRAVLHATIKADASFGLYENEYMFMLSFDDTGEKITLMKEMIDSHRTREAWSGVREATFDQK